MQLCKPKGHIKKYCWKWKKKNCREEGSRDGTSNADANYVNDNDDGGVLVATHGYNGGDEWILDSDYSFHMTPNKSFILTYEYRWGKRDDRKQDNILSGRFRSVQMRMFDGMVRTLSNVRHVPGLRKNLIFLGTLDKIGCRITCEDGLMKVAKGSLVVMKGKMNASFYAL